MGLLQAVAMCLWVQAADSSDRLGEGAFIMSLAMIMVPFIGRLLYGGKIDRYTLYAQLFTIVGIALLVLKKS